jgi:hypothetical protein
MLHSPSGPAISGHELRGPGLQRCFFTFLKASCLPVPSLVLPRLRRKDKGKLLGPSLKSISNMENPLSPALTFPQLSVNTCCNTQSTNRQCELTGWGIIPTTMWKTFRCFFYQVKSLFLIKKQMFN